MIFKFKLWPQLQQSDDLLKYVYQFIVDKNIILNDKNLLNEWLKIEKFAPSLFRATIKNEVKLNEKGILIIKNFNAVRSKYVWLFIVPTYLRGAIMAYCHHNPTNHHYGQIPTQDNAEQYFWWPKMRDDIRDYVNKCIICQFGKGTPFKKQQMRIRILPNVRDHIMADYMGPFFKRYYILVLIDYASGYTVLIPTDNCGAIVTADSIIHIGYRILVGLKFLNLIWDHVLNQL